MKKIAYSLIALAMAAFTFTSCEDVPSPFGMIIDPGTDGGEAITVDPAGSGTADDPYNVAAALQAASSLTGDDDGIVMVVKGYVSAIDEIDTSGSYGNATYYISDDAGGKANKLEIYRGYGLNGEKFNAAGATVIKDGDLVVVSGKVVNFMGSVLEFTTGSILLSINGEGGGGETPDTPSGDVQTVSIADFNAAAESTSVWYQLTGTVKNLKDGDQYGNFDLEDATGSVYVYGLLAEKGGESMKFQDLVAAKGIKNGSKLTIIGNRGSYNDKIEVVNAYFVSVEGGDTPDTPDTPSGAASGDGSQANPFNVVAAAAAASQLGDKEVSTDSYYIKGKISSIKYTFSAQYGTATFDISDDGTTSSTQFTCYSVYYFDNKAWVDGNTQVNVGDEVIVYGQITNYGGTLETASKKAYIYSLNGQTGNGGNDTPDTPDTPSGVTAISVADFNAAAESTDVWYQLTGTISNLKDGDQYGNFDLTDSTGSVYVYGVLSEKGGAKMKFQELVSQYGIENGKTITIIGNRGSYNGKIEVVNAYFVSVK